LTKGVDAIEKLLRGEEEDDVKKN